MKAEYEFAPSFQANNFLGMETRPSERVNRNLSQNQ